MDIVFIGALVVFFGVIVAFAAGCDKLGGKQ